MSDTDEESRVMMNEEVIMYIMVNNDLKMKKGKIAAQVGHLVGNITEELVTKRHKSLSNSKSRTNSGVALPDDCIRYFLWKYYHKCKKIVLKGTEAEMKVFLQHKECRHVRDAGYTQVAPGSMTVIGFLPGRNKEMFKDYKLL